MHYLALATDYDGAIAHDGVVTHPRYSRWIENSMKDGALAQQVESIERSARPDQARRALRETIERRYTHAG